MCPHAKYVKSAGVMNSIGSAKGINAASNADGCTYHHYVMAICVASDPYHVLKRSGKCMSCTRTVINTNYRPLQGRQNT